MMDLGLMTSPYNLYFIELIVSIFNKNYKLNKDNWLQIVTN